MANTRPKRLTPPGRISLDPKKFDDLLTDQGTKVRITPAMRCPNRSGGDIRDVENNHPLNCDVCKDDSQIVDLNEAAIEDIAFIQSVSLNREFEPASIFDVKDAMLTVRGGTRLYYFYKIEVLDHTSLFNDVLIKSSSAQDRLRYIPIDVDDGHEFYLLDKDGNRYTRGTHYEIDGTQYLQWLTTNRPPVNTLFSVIYPILPVFRVLELVHENRYYYESKKAADLTAIQLPQQAHIRWDYLAKGRGSNVPIEGQ
jgi:hypothetical protein